MKEYSPLTWGFYTNPPPDIPECGFIGELCPPPPERGKLPCLSSDTGGLRFLLIWANLPNYSSFDVCGSVRLAKHDHGIVNLVYALYTHSLAAFVTLRLFGCLKAILVSNFG